MNKVRLIIVIVMLVVTLSMLGVGVYTGLSANRGIKNQVDFNRGDENVFVEIKSEYNGPKLAEGKEKTYYFILDRENEKAYEDTDMIPAWDLGATNFKATETIISFTFTIKNINGAGGNLSIKVSDFAFDAEQRFETSCLVANDADSLETADKTILNSQDPLMFSVADGNQISFRIVYELKKFDKKFKFDNNIKILLTNNVAND